MSRFILRISPGCRDPRPRAPAPRLTRAARPSARGHLRDVRHLRVVLTAPVGDVLEPEEVELDGEPVRVRDENLVEIGFGQGSRPELDAALLEAPDEAPGFAGQEGD